MHDVGTSSTTRPPVVILAGGFGTRLAERTDELPKPMVEIGGMPVLWHILKIFSAYGHDDFVIACGYRGSVIKRFFLEYRDRQSDLLIDYRADHVERIDREPEPWRIALVDTGSRTMTGGRVRRIGPQVAGRTFMMTYGDGVADVDLDALLSFHREHGRLATMTVVHPPARFGLPALDGERVVRFEEKPDDGDRWINGGFFVLEPEVLDWIDGDESVFETDVLPRLAAADHLRAFRHDGFWQPMDTLRDVRTLNGLWATPDPPWRVWTSSHSSADAPALRLCPPSSSADQEFTRSTADDARSSVPITPVSSSHVEEKPCLSDPPFSSPAARGTSAVRSVHG